MVPGRCGIDIRGRSRKCAADVFGRAFDGTPFCAKNAQSIDELLGTAIIF